MLSFSYYFRKALKMPFKQLLEKAIFKFDCCLKEKIQKQKDLKRGTRLHFNADIIRHSYAEIDLLDFSSLKPKVANFLSQMYCEHKFDLLGSGWVQNSYNSKAFGVEGYKYEMNVIPPKRVAEDYVPIDWQKDFKSGYRWCETKWYKDQRIGYKPGSDIKVPWELARFQHLPQLAIFSVVLPEQKEKNLIEFKNQVLDFIQNNPPRFGVNWVCTMDVGIRAANMLLAFDLFNQLDNSSVLDEEFKQKFSNCIYEHGIHIINNLEYSENLTSNHYLSDIAGLLFISAYLDSSPEVDKWLAFSIQEIISEMRKQFYEDGGNFESSISYHRLSGELMIFSTALILGLKPDKVSSLKRFSLKKWRFTPKLRSLENQEFKIDQENNKIIMPQWFIDRLYKIGRFTVDITKPNGEIPQFGDNDSGRFFRFSPVGEFLTNKQAVEKYLNLKGYLENETLFWDENTLDHSSFISCFSGLFEYAIFNPTQMLEKSVISTLAKTKLAIKDVDYEVSQKTYCESPELPYSKKSQHFFEPTKIGIDRFFYPQSGIYIFKNDELYLAICATPLGQKNQGGHTHNDKLSYELWVKGKNLVRDPGTYLYTPLPEKRNLFRSTKVHSVPFIDFVEQNDWDELNYGLFGLKKTSVVWLINYGENFIELGLKFKDFFLLRKFVINQDCVIVSDRANFELRYCEFKLFSNGYGKLMNV